LRQYLTAPPWQARETLTLVLYPAHEVRDINTALHGTYANGELNLSCIIMNVIETKNFLVSMIE
jgi:hypothetical protein